MDATAWPTEFPGAWQNVPVPIRRFLAMRLVQRSLEIHEGPAGLIKFLYAGTTRRGPDGARFRVSYLNDGADAWPFVLEDAAAWLASQSQTAPQPAPAKVPR